MANNLNTYNEVIAVDDLFLGTKANLNDDVTFVEKSVVDNDLPTDVDIVYHLAAFSRILGRRGRD